MRVYFEMIKSRFSAVTTTLLKRDLQEKYPHSKMVSINSCRAEMALGLMVLEAGKMQKEGKTYQRVKE